MTWTYQNTCILRNIWFFLAIQTLRIFMLALRPTITNVDIEAIAATEPFAAYGDKTLEPGNVGFTEFDRLPHVARGRIRHPRLERLFHKLTAGNPHVDVVDNGAGSLPTLAFSLAQLGARVLVKEPHSKWLGSHQRHTQRKAHPDWRDRIVYPENLHQPTPAFISFWTNPQFDNGFFVMGDYTSIQDYLARDVMVGGYLVIQTDLAPVNFLQDEWISRAFVHLEGNHSFLPTVHNWGNVLSVQQRIG